jgi:hypothetical protein
MGDHMKALVAREAMVRDMISRTAPSEPRYENLQLQLTNILAAKAICETIMKARY